MTYIEVKSNMEKPIINLDIGQVVEGIKKDIIMGKFGFLIETEEFLISANDVLNNKIKNVPNGKQIRITRLEDVKSSQSGFSYKNYKVEYKE